MSDETAPYFSRTDTVAIPSLLRTSLIKQIRFTFLQKNEFH